MLSRGRAEVYLDGGVRRGSDVVLALALGARAVLVGRPAFYGLAFGGAKGVRAGARDPPGRDGERTRPPRLPLARRRDARPRHGAGGRVSVAELARNAVHLLPEGGLEAKLALGRPLRVKLGIDVTSPDIHVGRGIPLQRMRAFQDEGHVGVLIIGDYTTRIGDPSGRSVERPILSDEEIDRNARTYVEQAHQILIPDRTEVRFNSEWLAALSFADVIRLTRIMTVAQMLERDDFAGRYVAGQPISVSELLYPLMQAYDSVGDRGGRRARRDRPALQPARRPRGHAGLRPRAAGRADDAAPALLGRGEDELVGREQHPARRRSRGAVRKDDAHPGRAARGVVPPRVGGRRGGRRRPDGSEARSRPGHRRLAHTARRRLERPRSTSRAWCGRARLPRRWRRQPCRRTTPCTYQASSPRTSASPRARPAGSSRQGGVKVDGEVVSELDVPRARLSGAVVQAGKRRFVRVGE